MSLEVLSAANKVKLKQFFDDGMQVMRDIQVMKDSLKDMSDALADELEVKPAELRRALRAKFKENIDEEREKLDRVEELLEAAK